MKQRAATQNTHPTALDEHLDRFFRIILLMLEDGSDGTVLADSACLSRFHFQRLFRRLLHETPGALRRRLLLERAAWHLLHTDISVTEIAFDSGYATLEAFSRAFLKAYALSPSRYRRQAEPRFHITSTNGIHYDPRNRRYTRPLLKGTHTMDITDRLIEHDLWMTRRLLEKASTLSDTQLDAALPHAQQPLPFESKDATLRRILERLVATKEIWVAAVQNRVLLDQTDHSLPSLRARMEIAFAEFNVLVREVRDTGRWDESFVDALCTPAETFTYGGMIAHVITFSGFRRLTALKAMESLGITDLGYGDPMEWEHTLAGV